MNRCYCHKPGRHRKRICLTDFPHNPPQFKNLQTLRSRKGLGLFAGRNPVVLPAPTSTAEVETTEIRAKGDAKVCPRMPLLVDSVSFLTVDFRQKGVYASYTQNRRCIVQQYSVFGAIVLFLFSTATAIAQPGNWGGFTASQFQTGVWADDSGYHVGVRYSGNMQPVVHARINGRMLEVSVGQASGMPGALFQNQMSQRYLLPMDADPSRMSQKNLQGLVLITIPRRQPGKLPR